VDRPLILEAGTPAFDSGLAEAAERIRDGALVVFPTETVYGIGAIGPDAQERLAAVKGRKPDQPMALHVATPDALDATGLPASLAGRALARRHLPGPLTLAIPDRRGLTTGVRVPADDAARALISAVGRPLVATSANVHGSPAPAAWDDVSAAIRAAADVQIWRQQPCAGLASTVVILDRNGGRIVRPGPIAIGSMSLNVLIVCTGNICRSPALEALLDHRVKLVQAATPAALTGTPFAASFNFTSAGTSALVGHGADGDMRERCPFPELDMDHHVARLVDEEMIEAADLVLAIDRTHLARMRRMVSETTAQKIRLADPMGRDIADPYGGLPEEYDEGWRRIDAVADALIPELLGYDPA
jgi:tRNA threonylcarbamoyl adenosine modification protein (Sua5/YciO/YrdC/YwlC family)